MNKDLKHLRWLSIGFYVYSGFNALFALFPVIHLAVGIAMISGSFDQGQNPPPPVFGWFFVGIALIFIISSLALAVCNFLAGKYLKARTKYNFCFVIAFINCMFTPLGTVLGIFTIIVLLRESVKQLFKGVSTSQDFSSTGYNPPDWK